MSAPALALHKVPVRCLPLKRHDTHSDMPMVRSHARTPCVHHGKPPHARSSGTIPPRV